MIKCEDCIHKHTCAKREVHAEAYENNGIILDCKTYKSRDDNDRIKQEAKKLIEKILKEL